MFAVLLQKIEERCTVLENFLLVCELVDESTSNSGSPLFKALQAKGIAPPNVTEDRVFRHCAVMTQAYALYEWFAETMLSSWLVRLPRYHRLSELPEGFRTTYRQGVARIVQNIDHRRYRHLSLKSVLDQYLLALQGDPKWEFINDALILHDANLRYSEFVKMFNSVDLTGIWSALEQNKHILAFKADTDSDESLESQVLDLVTFRNEASHGTPDEIFGFDTLRQWILFVRAFCLALADVVTHRIVTAEVVNHPECVLGTVTETFKNNTSVAVCDRGTLTVGDNLYFLRETDCVNAVIESLQLDDVDQKDVRIQRPGVEVGLKTSAKVRKKARLIRLVELSDAHIEDVPESLSEAPSGWKAAALKILERAKDWVSQR